MNPFTIASISCKSMLALSPFPKSRVSVSCNSRIYDSVGASTSSSCMVLPISYVGSHSRKCGCLIYGSKERDKPRLCSKRRAVLDKDAVKSFRSFVNAGNEEDCSRHWTPPKKGSFVVNCAARIGHGIAGISAIARDCNGDVIAATVARKRCERKIDAQLQSILAAFKLIHMLTEEKGIIKRNQDITIQTHHKRALQMINGDTSDGIYADEEEEDDDVSDDNDDCDGEDEYNITLIGEAELAAGLPQSVKDMVEKDKMRAGLGLPVTKKAAESSASKEAKNVVKSAASEMAKNVVKSAASNYVTEGTSATKAGAGSVVLEAASQVLNAEDSTASEKMIKGLAVEDLKIV